MEYRITITKDRTSGKFVLEVPDVPEAHTIGASKSGVIARGVDALATALDGYMAARRPIALSRYQTSRRLTVYGASHAHARWLATTASV
jgi:predicted RNase H-like HicB family nuclease